MYFPPSNGGKPLTLLHNSATTMMAPHGGCSDYAGQYKAYFSTLSISTFWHDPDLEGGDCVRGNCGEDGPRRVAS